MSAKVLRALFKQGGEQELFGFCLSAGLHLLLAAAIILWPGFGNSTRQVFVPTYNVNLVGAPKLPAGAKAAPAPAPKPSPKPKAAAPVRTTPKKAVKPKPKPKPQAKPKEAIGTKKTVSKRITRKKKTDTKRTDRELERRLSKLKRKVNQERNLESALSRLERKVASRRQVQASTPAASSKAAGPVGGGNGRGRSSGKMSTRLQLYLSELDQLINRQWILPEATVEKASGLLAVVSFRISKNGKLEKVWLEQGSGNPGFDQSCLKAVTRAAPFPPLPPEIRTPSYEVGLRFSNDGNS